MVKHGALVEIGKGPWQRNIVINKKNVIFVWGREDEDKQKQTNDQT